MGIPKTLNQVSPRLLLVVAGVLLLFAGINIWRFGGAAYFAATGHPLSWPTLFHPAAKVITLPHFQTSESIGQDSLSPGDTQTIAVTTSANMTSKAMLEVWIYSPHHKEVWKSPEVVPTTYKGGTKVTTNYSYTLPDTSAPGMYTVSALVAAPNEHTDYYVKENFAEFTVQ